MAVSFTSILADVMSQLNAIKADTVAIASTTYSAISGGTSVSTDYRSTDWPVEQIQQAILDIEYQIIYEICLNEFHPERTDFNGASATVGSGSNIPATSSGGDPFLGKFNLIKDNTNNRVLTERPFQVVKMAAENTNSMFSLAIPYVYAIVGQRIYLNADNPCIFEGPAKSRATWTGNIRCRDHHKPAIIAGSVAQLLPKEGAWSEAWQEQVKIFSSYIEQIRSVNRFVVQPYPSQV